MSSIESSSPIGSDAVSLAFRKSLDEFKGALAALQEQIPADQPPRSGDDFHRQVLQAFEASQAACREFELEIGDDADLLLAAQTMFRQETDPWFAGSWIAHRARSKPSGFAGDYEMLIKLYNEATPATGLGGYLDLCIMDLPLARAVRARLAAARQFLLTEIASRSGDVRVLDIASGPCREYRDWPNLGEQQVEVVAIDNDPIALDFVANEVVPQLGPSTRLQPHRYNALRTRSAEATIKKFGRFDIIYSVGLCDYLTDAHLVGLLSGWRDTLEDDGVMYIAFKDTEQYDKTPYQWHLDWFFYQRTLEDVLSLYEQAGFDLRSMVTTRDATHIIINFITRRTAGEISRRDAGHTSVIAPLSTTSPQDERSVR